MEINNKTDLILKIFCILVLIALNLAIYINGRELSCDKCQVKFTSITQARTEEVFVNVSDLYNSYLENDCFIKFSDTGIIQNVK